MPERIKREPEEISKEDVHTFQYGGLKLVYDVNSGSLHEVDNLAWELITLLLEGRSKGDIRHALLNQYPAGEIRGIGEIEEAFRQLEELREEKLLFSPPPPLDKEKLPASGVKALCLFISHNCNLYCRYCFARKEEGYKLPQMSWDVGKKAVDFLLENEVGRYREIDFFGGEPLLNFPVIREIVAYARKKSQAKGQIFGFTLTTNAVLLTDEIIDFLNSEGIDVILSLDGRPQVHDCMRSFKNGKGSYEVVVKNIKKILQARGRRQNDFIRGTYTRFNLDFCSEIRHFLEQGFDSLSLEPVVCGEKENYALREEDLPVLEREYDRLVELFLEQKEKGNPFRFYHFLLDLQEGPCLYKRLSGCGAGTEYLAVAADGGLYPCHQFAGIDDFYMGNLMDEPLVLKREIGDNIAGAARDREDCQSCWARYLCGRGCAASSYFMAKDLRKNYKLGCALQKIRLERALYLQVRDKVDGSLLVSK